MFAMPKWEADVPSTKINFSKAKHLKQQKSINIIKTPSTQRKKKHKRLKVTTSPLHERSRLTIQTDVSPKLNNGTKGNKKPNKKIKKNKTNLRNSKSIESDLNIEIQNFDTDKPDEVILNCKKKKLIDALKNDDIEDLLFTENSSSGAPAEESAEQNVNSISVQNKVKKTPGPLTKKKKLHVNDMSINNKMQKINAPLSKNKKKLHLEIKSSESSINKTNKLEIECANINNNKKLILENKNKVNHSIIIKKEKLKKMLDTSNLQRNTIKVNSSNLRQRMLERLKAAQFRYINEKLYTSSGIEAKQLFQSDPLAFQTYHQGYQQQLKKWPVNPLDIIIKRILKLPKTNTIADMGCGEATLSRRIPHTVRSFDLVSSSPEVEVCDMAHTPLMSASVDAVVYCLALMGTDLTQYLVEANRVLKMGGSLLIAEVESRFDNVDDFTRNVQQLGFSLKKLDKSHKVFYFMEFSKVREAPAKKSKRPMLTLKPCLYKRR